MRGIDRVFVGALILVPLVLLGACSLIPEGAPLVIEGVDQYAVEPESLDGVSLAVWAAGERDGQRIVYVHGTPGTTAAWKGYLREPIAGFRSIAFDRPGFGETSPTGAMVSFEDQARAIEPFLEPSADGSMPILVGHSLGGPIVAQAAAMYPGRVGGLVVIAGSLDPELASPRWYNYTGDFPLIRPFLGRAMRNSNDEIMAAPEQTVLLSEMLGNVVCPVVIVHGTDDGLVPYANVRFMESAFTNAERVRVITIENEGHFIVWSHEQVIREAIESLAARPGA